MHLTGTFNSTKREKVVNHASDRDF